jgi:chorismate dehydratase
MLELSDAALIIGDPAMLIDRSALHVYDLAEEWGKHTGLPFVFAFWGVRTDSRVGLVSDSSVYKRIDFLEAKLEGTTHARELAGVYSERLRLPQEDLFKYLTENISYDLDGESLKGLRLYYQLANECGLIEEPRDLVFLD